MALTTKEPEINASMPGTLCKLATTLFWRVAEVPKLDRIEDAETVLGGTIVAFTTTEPADTFT